MDLTLDDEDIVEIDETSSRTRIVEIVLLGELNAIVRANESKRGARSLLLEEIDGRI